MIFLRERSLVVFDGDAVAEVRKVASVCCRVVSLVYRVKNHDSVELKSLQLTKQLRDESVDEGGFEFLSRMDDQEEVFRHGVDLQNLDSLLMLSGFSLADLLELLVE